MVVLYVVVYPKFLTVEYLIHVSFHESNIYPIYVHIHTYHIFRGCDILDRGVSQFSVMRPVTSLTRVRVVIIVFRNYTYKEWTDNIIIGLCKLQYKPNKRCMYTIKNKNDCL